MIFKSVTWIIISSVSLICFTKRIPILLNKLTHFPRDTTWSKKQIFHAINYIRTRALREQHKSNHRQKPHWRNPKQSITSHLHLAQVTQFSRICECTWPPSLARSRTIIETTNLPPSLYKQTCAVCVQCAQRCSHVNYPIGARQLLTCIPDAKGAMFLPLLRGIGRTD